MSCTRMISRAWCLSALLVLLALPALGQTLPTIQKGVDLFETSSTGGTLVDFASTPIPAGFFCPGSAAFTGKVGLKGVPLTTAPVGVAGSTDTIVERLKDAVFPSGATSATIPVVVRALRLTSTGDVEIFCPDEGKNTYWRVDTCLCGGLQPTTNLTLTVNQSCGCGVANGTLKLNVCLRFTRVDTGQTVGPVSQTITLNVNNLPWCPNAGTGDRVIASPFGVDTNCDGEADLQLPGTTNFHPSRTCANSAADCWVQYASLTRCHPNYTNPGAHDHCINPVCKPRQ
jgi:hypothetical protein